MFPATFRADALNLDFVVVVNLINIVAVKFITGSQPFLVNVLVKLI
jgi:hypothetical protein